MHHLCNAHNHLFIVLYHVTYIDLFLVLRRVARKRISYRKEDSYFYISNTNLLGINIHYVSMLISTVTNMAVNRNFIIALSMRITLFEITTC